MTPITYTSEQPRDWAEALDFCEELETLRQTCREWRDVAPDAVAVAEKMSKRDFGEFMKGLKAERRGKYAGDQWVDKYGALAMPELMVKVSHVAAQFGVPWGCAYIRMKEIGKL